MSQNTSSAVMAQRKEAKDSLDLYPTPPWATRALMEYVLKPAGVDLGWLRQRQTVWEPACGLGDMVAGLEGYFERIWASDVYDHGCPGMFVNDFLFPGLPARMRGEKVHWIITNPPFRLAQEFIENARLVASHGIAMLVRTAFLEGIDRYRTLFEPCPPTLIGQFVERVPMVRGRLDEDASSATAYCWLVWCQPQYKIARQPLMWIPPCRSSLERAEDYPPTKTEAAPIPLFETS